MTVFNSLTSLQIWAGLGLCSSAYLVGLIVYRVWLSSIASFPGPFLARTTFWYEFYYNWWKLGTYHLKIKEMHERYGPIVRVTPNELHVADPSFYHNLYVSAAVRKTDNYPRAGAGTGFEDMTALSTTHDSHRRLRAPLEPFFSRPGIVRVEARVVARVKKLCDRLIALENSNRVVNLTYAINSLATDIISSVTFEEPSDFLGDPDFNKAWFDTLKKGIYNVPLFVSLPWLAKVTNWTVWDDKARRQIMRTKLRPSDDAITRTDTTVFDHLVHSDLHESQYGSGGFTRLAQLLQQAGAHNVSHTLGTIVTYLLLDENKQKRLRKEIELVFAGEPERSPSWTELEKTPYLAAAIKEGLRMAIGGMNRAPRVSPDVELEFREWKIPKGVPVSMTTYWMHMNPDIFPEPQEFRPERWLCEPEKLKVMQRYYVPFSKGSRNCFGANLVLMQLSHTLAQLFRPGAPEIVLYETDVTDIIAVHGYLYPIPRIGSKGIRAIIQ